MLLRGNDSLRRKWSFDQPPDSRHWRLSASGRPEPLGGALYAKPGITGDRPKVDDVGGGLVLDADLKAAPAELGCYGFDGHLVKLA